MPVRRREEMKETKIKHGRMLKYSSTRKENREECGMYHDNEANWQKKKDIEKRPKKPDHAERRPTHRNSRRCQVVSSRGREAGGYGRWGELEMKGRMLADEEEM
jgi:hypothetical protein